MSRQGTAETVGSKRSRRGGHKSGPQHGEPEQRQPEPEVATQAEANLPKQWNSTVYRAGLGVFALAFVGVAVSIATGNQVIVIACITVAVAGGVVAAFELCRMMRYDMRLLWSEPGDTGDDDGGGGWGRPPEPEVIPPQPDGMWPELDEPAWWPAFERDLSNWVLDTSDTPGA